jgi:ParB family chromosome partitioning protein
MDCRFIALTEIDLDDSSFEIKRYAGSPGLHESIDRFGILDPPWLRRRGRGHVVIDGYKRLRRVRENGAHGAICLLFQENCDTRELWMRRIEKKMFEREINPAEKAQIVFMLLRLFQPGGIPPFLLSGINISNRPEVLISWASLSTRGADLLEILASGDIAERAALEIAGWDKPSMDSVLGLLQILRCSASIQMEIVERINEIGLRESKSGAEIIGRSRMREILTSESLNRRQKTQAVRDYLFELRHPRLNSRQKQFARRIEALGLPSGLRIIPPPAFEGDNWRMELSFTGIEDLRTLVASTGQLVETDRLGEVIEPGVRANSLA